MKLGASAACRESWVVALALAAASLGCADSGPTPSVAAVKPTRAYSDVAIPLTIQAPGLRAGLFVDVTGQTASFDDGTVHAWLVPNTPGLPTISLDPVRWQYTSPSQSYFRATIPAAIDPDIYALRMEAPNGHAATLPNAFEELGPDEEAPNISLGAPVMDQMFPENATGLAVFSADDRAGQLVDVRLETEAGEVLPCPADVDLETGLNLSQKACMQTFHTPALPDDVPTSSFWVQAVGGDVAGNLGTSQVSVRVAHLPRIDAFMPALDGLPGGSLMTVTGRYFFEDAQAFIGGVPLDSQVRSGDTAITGLIPSSTRAATLNVEVRTTVGTSLIPGSGSFRYVGPPRLRSVHPTVGPTGGGIKMTIAGNDLRDVVTIKFGASFADALELTVPISHEADDKVTGCLPPGHGTVTVWASDPITGQSHLDAAFTYTDGAIDPTSVVLCDPSTPPVPAAP